jgi:hypothetical protein
MALKLWQTARTSLSVGTSAYAAGDALGTKVGIDVPDAGIVRSIIITDVDDEAGTTVNVVFFESEPTGIAANAAFALADADTEKVVGFRLVDQPFDAVNALVLYESGVDIPYRTDGGKLWLQCELASATTPTFTATTDVKIKLIIEY